MAAKKKKTATAAKKKKATTTTTKAKVKAPAKAPAKKVAAAKTPAKKAPAAKAPPVKAPPPAPPPAKATKKKAAAAKAPAEKPKKPKDIRPTKEEEARFWSLIEDAWATQGEDVNAARRALATRSPEDDEPDVGLVTDALDEVVESLEEVFAFEEFPKEELVAMDRVLERKLYDIDREEIQEVTDGSDDGFLYARGFIVALGKEFYDAVNKHPEMALDGAECEEMCYLPAHVYSKRFGGEFPDTGAKISRESASNPAGWDDADDADADEDEDEDEDGED